MNNNKISFNRSFLISRWYLNNTEKRSIEIDLRSPYILDESVTEVILNLKGCTRMQAIFLIDKLNLYPSLKNIILKDYVGGGDLSIGKRNLERFTAQNFNGTINIDGKVKSIFLKEAREEGTSVAVRKVSYWGAINVDGFCKKLSNDGKSVLFIAESGKKEDGKTSVFLYIILFFIGLKMSLFLSGKG